MTDNNRVENQREFRFGDKTPAIAAGIMVVMCVVIAIGFDLIPTSGPPPPLAFKIGMPAFFVFGALFMAYIGLQQATRVLTLTDTGLIDRSLLGRREIPFDQVVSITTKDVPTKAGTIEVTTVKSAAKTISIPSRLSNYAGLVEALQAKVGAQVVPNDSQAIAAEKKQSLLVNVIGLFIIGCLFGAGLGGLGGMALHEGQDALQRQIDLDTRGKRTTGEALGVGERNSKSPSYFLNYSYQVGDKSYARASTVSRDTYDNQQIGGKVPVDYLPDDPAISRVTVSIAKKNAREKITAARVMFGIACGLPFLLGILGFTQKPRYHAPPRRTSSR